LPEFTFDPNGSYGTPSFRIRGDERILDGSTRVLAILLDHPEQARPTNDPERS
jgi:hypothetical protein